MLALEDVTFAHPGAPAGYRLTMTAAAGEVTAVRGRSGAGKSTLLDLVAGFLAPSAGRIIVDGRDVTPLRPEQRPVSILFQSETLFEHLTAARNVALGLPGRA
ncbi:MAG TPA: ATP-binding cassette domain-containing protein, partial [Devosiaceae bacterium]|nr:ATP-binding cassette domain-containing protein [Devosiaceae bacterium]